MTSTPWQVWHDGRPIVFPNLLRALRYIVQHGLSIPSWTYSDLSAPSAVRRPPPSRRQQR